MYCRYVINKINHRTKCYQGILVTLGTKMHKGELSDPVLAEVRSLFDDLLKVMPAPPEFEEDDMLKSISWLKIESPDFALCLKEISRAALVLQEMGFEVLKLETEKLAQVLYEDNVQVITASGVNSFRISPAV